MRGIITESLAEALGVVLYAGIAAVLTVVGALAELASLQDIAAGQSLFGLWEVAAGALLLYAAYNVFTGLVLSKLRGVRGASS